MAFVRWIADGADILLITTAPSYVLGGQARALSKQSG